MGIGISVPNLKKLLADKGNFVENTRKEFGRPAVRNRTEKVIDFFAKYNLGDDDLSLATLLMKRLDLNLDNLSSLKKYRGEHNLVRPSESDDSWTEGSLKITEGNENHSPWMHYHETTRRIARTENAQKFRHSGPVFALGGRIYFLGVGHDAPGKYIRTMIFHSVDEPENEVTFGILLTETLLLKQPMATKIAIVRKDQKLTGDFNKNLHKIFQEDRSNKFRIEGSGTRLMYGNS